MNESHRLVKLARQAIEGYVREGERLTGPVDAGDHAAGGRKRRDVTVEQLVEGDPLLVGRERRMITVLPVGDEDLAL